MLIRVALVGVIGFCVLCAAAILLGQQQDTPEFFRYLRKCGAVPCYLDIVPGTSDWIGALSMFQGEPGVKFDLNTNIVYEPLGFSGNVRLFASGRFMTVGEMDLYLRPTSVSIGAIIAQIGTPCAAVDNNGQLGVIFPGMSVLLSDDHMEPDRVLRPTTLVDEISLVGAIKSCEHVPDTLIGHDWRGFVRYSF